MYFILGKKYYFTSRLNFCDCGAINYKLSLLIVVFEIFYS